MSARRPIRNPPNPFDEAHLEWDGDPPPALLEVHEEEAKRALAKNDSPDVGFRYGLNPYRGCFHGCAYCYARPSHQYLGFGAGTDFERRIVVKTNIAERLRAAFMKKSWRGETIALSGNTDCYQPLEASYRLTRRCLEVCLEFKNPVVVITKSALVKRDTDVLAALAREGCARVAISVPFADDAMAAKIEPWATRPSKRFVAMRVLAEAGVPVGLALAPVIPGLNDSDVPKLLERAADAGATTAFMTLVRLPREVLPVFDERLAEAFPDRADKVRRAIQAMKGGRMNRSELGTRMRGEGERWKLVEQMFETTCQRLGLNDGELAEHTEAPSPFRRPTEQLSLFD